ncbi:2464_t:CDS:2, partial [Dentiscutata heterogama]
TRTSKVLALGSKRKHIAISGLIKYEICQKLSGPNPPMQKELALDYDAQLKKEHSPGYPMIEEVLERWLQYAFARQMMLTDEVLIEKAKSIASNIGEQQFCGSNRCKCDKNILLLVDGTPVHCLEKNVKLNHICIEFLLQMPLCIFNLAYNFIHDKPNESPPAFTIRDAIYFVADAWQNVISNTISIKNEQLYELDDLIAELPINNPLSAS